MCVCCPSGMIDIEAETPRGTCSYVDESCICGHHVSKDFCIPVINEVCSGSQGKFWGRTHAQKNVSYCSLLLQTETITATMRDSRHYSNDLLQGGLEDCLLYLFVYGCSAYWSLCCDNRFNFDTRKLLVYHFSLNTAATPFNFPNVMWREKMTCRFNYVIINGGLNVGDFVQSLLLANVSSYTVF